MKKIAVVLPLTENYSIKYSGAVSLFTKEYIHVKVNLNIKFMEARKRKISSIEIIKILKSVKLR